MDATSPILILVLGTLVFLMGVSIAVMVAAHNRIRRKHEKTIEELKYLIAALTDVSERQSGQLQLSDELRKKLHAAREGIDKELIELQFDLVEIVSKNNLTG